MPEHVSSGPVVLDELTITPVRVPEDVNAPEAADFRDVALGDRRRGGPRLGGPHARRARRPGADVRPARAGLAPTPAEWIDDHAWMKSRMSTDAPVGDAVIDEEVWDADRVRRMEAQWGDSAATTIVGAAQHLDSGRLVAFTELVSFRVPGKPIEQNDTLVLKDHRGHRLGALVKTETLLRARDVFPEGQRIVTGNAEENRPMLAVNEAMGFTPTRYNGEWQKMVA
jgi:GNAT superfamily N-acetyltransferase